MENQPSLEPDKPINLGDPNEPAQPTPKADPTGLDGAKIIGGSLLIAAILISASIFYNSNLILKAIANLPSGTVAGAATGQTQGTIVQVKARSDQPVMGKADAKVTIIEFADFQCPFCQRFFNDTMKQIKEKYVDTGKVKYVFRHFPLPNHQNAEISSVGAECANRQGKFWEFHDLLFIKGKSNGTGLSAADLKNYADQIGLNRTEFQQCLDSKATLAAVQGDLEEGRNSTVSGTPTFFINGKKLVGALPFTNFEKEIEEVLKK